MFNRKKTPKTEKPRKKFDRKNFIFIGLAVYLLILLFSQQGTLSRNRSTYNNLQDKIQAAQNENAKLKKEYESIGSDEYIEKKAREAGLVRSDEIVFITEN